MEKESNQDGNQDSNSFALVVGESVRAPLPNHAKAKRRVVVATVHPGNASCLVLWESEAPQPLAVSFPASRKTRFLRKRFLLAPNVQLEDEVREESTFSNDELCSLLPIEKNQEALQIESTTVEEINIWKKRGDDLLRLGDAVAAVPFYEVALKLSSLIQIGGSILLKEGGKIKVAEIDCIDEDEGTIDISMEESGEERTIKDEREIQLCILDPDTECLQERILLNLSRCFLQIAETLPVLSFRSKYLQSAFVSCTLALSIDSFHKSDADGVPSSTVKNALLLRSKAYASLNKYPYAIADMKRLLSLDPHNKEAKRRLREFERQKVVTAKTEKKLVKEMCQWVQGQVDSNNGKEESSSVSSVGVDARRDDRPQHGHQVVGVGPKQPQPVFTFVVVLMGVALAWFVQNAFR